LEVKTKHPIVFHRPTPFLCKAVRSPFISRPDIVILLDTSSWKPIKHDDLSIYWVDFVKINRFRQCRIKVPADSLSKITKYKYQYGTVKLVTDD